STQRSRSQSNGSWRITAQRELKHANSGQRASKSCVADSRGQHIVSHRFWAAFHASDSRQVVPRIDALLAWALMVLLCYFTMSNVVGRILLQCFDPRCRILGDDKSHTAHI